MNFENIEYLNSGNIRQRLAYATLTKNNILSILKKFDPILVGTIPINIDIENSDLDIICFFQDQQDFQKILIDNFSDKKSFTIKDKPSIVVASFFIDNFEIEIFGQNIPTKQQFAYRHLIIEYQLLNEYGEEFRKQIIALKKQGYKTEPAFGLALGLTGNPYSELLKLESSNKIPKR